MSASGAVVTVRAVSTRSGGAPSCSRASRFSTCSALGRPDSSASSTATKIYEVVSGDSLSKIAKREYGNANEWKRIFEANRDILKDPNKIYPGQKLKIPPK